ncbi:hypothetical protein ACQV2C_07790 [Pantoea allii]|uniref:hypothetical protein n=1 Tax=Pantoea allii TaxID=574096 RepID=UPI003D31ACF4
MNKNFNLAGKQRAANRRNLSNAEARLSERYGQAEYKPVFRELLFAYKGIVICNKEHHYCVHKQLKISGCDPSMLDGMWNDGPLFQQQIDYMLETAKPERHAEVRKQYFNWKCPRCKVSQLYEKERCEFTDTEFPEVRCKYCPCATRLSELQVASDEVFR